jgi:hypothetical protein
MKLCSGDVNWIEVAKCIMQELGLIKFVMDVWLKARAYVCHSVSFACLIILDVHYLQAGTG